MYSAIERQQLLTIVREAIRHGLSFGSRMDVDPHNYTPQLQEIRASFVTLKIDGLLRGCMGNIKARETLAESVAHNAYSAAFLDPRFAPLHSDEMSLLNIEISILSPLEAMSFSSEQDLIDQLTPGRDGLVISSGEHSATFLPSVWEQTATPKKFLQHLKEKAGLDADEWPDDLEAQRYTTHSISS